MINLDHQNLLMEYLIVGVNGDLSSMTTLLLLFLPRCAVG